MNSRVILASLIVYFVLAAIAATGPGCANIVAPGGGPRDTLPPVLVNVVPADSTRNFKGSRITFNFDEYVNVDNPQENVIVSPTPKTAPLVESKLRTVTVRLKDTLEENTTYLIQFGNAIRDINENNILKNFSYVFTTGNVIDSLTLSGNVVTAQTGTVDSTMIVMLYRNLDDSAVVKERPRYYTKLDGKGNFQFRNLAPGTYAVYALKDVNGNKEYDEKAEAFAFVDAPVTLSDSTPHINLYAYEVNPETEKKPATTTQTKTPSRTLPPNAAQDKRLKFSTTLESGKLDILGKFVITYPNKLAEFDSSKMILTDSKYDPVAGYTLLLDTTQTKIEIDNKWTPGATYNLILEKDYASDSLGNTALRTDTVKFSANNLTDYGSFRIRFANFDSTKNPVAQFYISNELKNSYPLEKNELYVPLIKPGDYQLRILFDTNKNGKWDPGNFFGEKKQPEKVFPKNIKFSIKANWDNELSVDLQSVK